MADIRITIDEKDYEIYSRLGELLQTHGRSAAGRGLYWAEQHGSDAQNQERLDREFGRQPSGVDRREGEGQRMPAVVPPEHHDSPEAAADELYGIRRER